ncbi:MAG: excinuclease ABC subunit UvrC [Bacilli bacterium]
MKDKLNLIPHKPGCYLMKDENDAIIYIGKAKDLYNRVRSYFVGSHDTKTTMLVSNIRDFEYIITSSETEALILEINLIKKHQPKYNISLTDDKSYPYIHITDEVHPRLIYVRDLHKKSGIYYGPYPNGSAASTVVTRLNKIFPFRKCRILPKKECLYYHLGMCLAPCIQEVKPETYDEMRAKVDSLLKGKATDEIKKMRELMQTASHKLEFEKALEYRNLINDLEIVSEKQKMEGYHRDTDVFGYFQDKDQISIQIFHWRDGKMIERRGLLFPLILDAEEFFSEFIVRFYVEQHHPLPEVIIAAPHQKTMVEEALNHPIIIPKRGKNKELLNLVNENAKNKLDELVKLSILKQEKTEGAILALEEQLGLSLETIEMFDNSNISGSSPVSAMIVYQHHQFQKSLYRKYHIKTVIGANDVATMKEVVLRRYKNFEANPSLILMDGGKMQVDAALESLQQLNRVIPVAGLIKDDHHRTEAIYYQNIRYPLNKDSYEYRLLEKIQEEVHRYAITFFRKTHTKNVISSQLDHIQGIGPVKKNQILRILGQDDFKTALNQLKLTDEQKTQVIACLERH